MCVFQDLEMMSQELVRLSKLPHQSEAPMSKPGPQSLSDSAHIEGNSAHNDKDSTHYDRDSVPPVQKSVTTNSQQNEIATSHKCASNGSVSW